MASAADDSEKWASRSIMSSLLQRYGSRLSPVMCSEESLRRYLIANRGNIEGAGEALLATQTYRRTETPWWPKSACPLDQIKSDIESGKAYIDGEDESGCPLVWVRAFLHDKHEDRTQLKRFITFFCDEAVARMTTGDKSASQINIIVDFRNFGYAAGFDPGAGISIVQILSAHFPERLKTLNFVNPPMIFPAFWTLVKPFVDPRTASKIAFVSQEKLAETLKIPRSRIPAFLCGESKHVYAPAQVNDYLTVRSGSLPDADPALRENPWRAL